LEHIEEVQIKTVKDDLSSLRESFEKFQERATEDFNQLRQ
jgi:hypothetical protein